MITLTTPGLKKEGSKDSMRPFCRYTRSSWYTRSRRAPVPWPWMKRMSCCPAAMARSKAVRMRSMLSCTMSSWLRPAVLRMKALRCRSTSCTGAMMQRYGFQVCPGHLITSGSQVDNACRQPNDGQMAGAFFTLLFRKPVILHHKSFLICNNQH